MVYAQRMANVRISKTGKITLSKRVLAHLGVAVGDSLAVSMQPGGRIVITAASRDDITSIFGLLKRPENPVLTDEELDAAIRDGWILKEG
jgi:formylmethanofuran dehydrogenase subunit D